jgi:hypothetical protein
MRSFEDSLTFSADVEPDVSLRNFWPPESGFIWSTGKWSEVIFPFNSGSREAPSEADLIIDMDVLRRPTQLDAQHVFLYLNGLRLGSYFVQRRATFFATFNSRILKSTGNVLIFDTPDVASPSMFGELDKRQLAVQLFSLQIRKNS